MNTPSVILRQNASSNYAPRTYANAKKADWTVAIAIDFTTAGENCTKKAAGEKITCFQITQSTTRQELLEFSRELWRVCKRNNVKTLNVAGNGIYTWSQHGFTQEFVDDILLKLLRPVVEHWDFDLVISGGQTGTDIAGVKAAYNLGVNVEAHLPKGYKQRGTDKVDRDMLEEDILRQITG